MRQNLYRFAKVFGVWLAAVLGAAFLLFPKYPITESLFKRTNAFLIARKVEEGFFSLKYSSGRLLLPRGFEVDFQSFVLKTLPPSAQLVCPSGKKLEIHPSGLSVKVHSKGFDCIKPQGFVKADLTLTCKGEIFGKLLLKGFEYKGFKLQRAEFLFKGFTFGGKIEVFGTTFRGGGKVRVDFSKGVYVDANFKGGGMNLNYRGFLP